MYRVFNMGIGMILVVPATAAQSLIVRATELGDPAYRIGTILASSGEGPLVEYVD
jgi:phosphoribosylformylglycinamidine cyclo-ligase